MSSLWYESLAQTLEGLKRTLLPREVKEYQLDKLQHIARRIDEFAPADPVCQGYRRQIEGMAAELSGAPLPYERNRVYICAVGAMVGHLKKSHNLVNEGEHLGLWLAIGLLAGGITGLLIGNTPLATGAGLLAGLAIGAWLDVRAKRAGRVI